MTDQTAPDVDYVSAAGWLRTPTRREVVVVVADEFERPELPRQHELVRWPRSSRGWRSQDRLHPRVLERRSAG
jgi:hypothetical protein